MALQHVDTSAECREDEEEGRGQREGEGRGRGEGGIGKKEEQPICIRSPILTVHSPYLLLWRSHTRMVQSTELLKSVRLLEEGWKRRRVTMPFDPCRLCVQ